MIIAVQMQEKLRKGMYIPVLCPCIVAAIASKSTSKSELAPPVGTPICLPEFAADLFSDSPDPIKLIKYPFNQFAKLGCTYSKLVFSLSRII